MSGQIAVANRDARGAPRDEVMHRTRATGGDGETMKLVIVNISFSGLMARCETTPDVGGLLDIHLPMLGRVPATVRWALGGRVGCEFHDPIPLADYYGMLSALLRAA